MKAYPLRLDDEQAAALRLVARVDGTTVADEIRQAITAHLGACRADPVFQRRLRARMDRNLEIHQGLLEVGPPRRAQMLVSSAGTTSGSGIGAAS
jgi:hypothetical protein